MRSSRFRSRSAIGFDLSRAKIPVDFSRCLHADDRPKSLNSVSVANSSRPRNFESRFPTETLNPDYIVRGRRPHAIALEAIRMSFLALEPCFPPLTAV